MICFVVPEADATAVQLHKVVATVILSEGFGCTQFVLLKWRSPETSNDAIFRAVCITKHFADYRGDVHTHVRLNPSPIAAIVQPQNP